MPLLSLTQVIHKDSQSSGEWQSVLYLYFMCGIVGIVSSNKTELSKIGAATRTLSKRGSDNNSSEHFDRISLGHARLSIIDTAKDANQPFTDCSERYIIVFNGEIYNFIELKKELEEAKKQVAGWSAMAGRYASGK